MVCGRLTGEGTPHVKNPQFWEKINYHFQLDCNKLEVMEIVKLLRCRSGGSFPHGVGYRGRCSGPATSDSLQLKKGFVIT